MDEQPPCGVENPPEYSLVQGVKNRIEQIAGHINHYSQNLVDRHQREPG